MCRIAIAASILVLTFMAAGPNPAAAQASQLTAHLVAGSCLDPGEAIARLRAFRQQGTGNPPVWTSFTTVDHTLPALAGDAAITVAAENTLIACGDIPVAGGTDLYIVLRQQDGSGYHGIAWLHADGDQTRVSLFVFREDQEPSPRPTAESPITPTPLTADPCAGAESWYRTAQEHLEEADRVVNLLTTTLPIVGLGSGPQLIDFSVTLTLVADDLRAGSAPPALVEARDALTSVLDELAERLKRAGERLNAFDSAYRDDLKKIPGLVSDYAAANARLNAAVRGCGIDG